MNALTLDVRHALRSLRKNGGFTAVAVLTLALSIAATTTIFGVVDAVIVRGLPFADPDRLITIWERNPDGQDFVASEPDYLDFAAQSTSISGLGAYRPADAVLTGDGDPQQLRGFAASRSLFPVLGVRPILGRGFLAEEDAPGDSARVVVLGHAVWATRFGGDSTIVGRSIALNGRPHTVVGVLPASFRLPEADAYFPLNASLSARRSNHWLQLVGRLRGGATVADAQTDFDRITRELGARYPTSAGWGARVELLERSWVDDRFRRGGWVLLGATGVLLLLACANVANLLLARAATRETEMGVRTAIGASRWQLVRHWLVESALIVAAAATLGITGAFWGITAVRAYGVGRIPRLEEVSMDGRAIGAALLLSVFTTLACGLIPALRASRVDSASVLGDGPRGGVSRRSRRIRDTLVVFQMVLSIVLLVGAGLMVRSFAELSAARAGFDADHVLAVTLHLPPQRYDEPATSIFFTRLTTRLGALPGVRAAGATAINPFTEWNFVNDVTPEERAATAPASGFTQAGWRSVTPSLFAAMGIPVIRGRVFEPSDPWNGPRNAVISQSLATKLWPGENPIGKRLFWGGTDGKPRTVIGVVGDVRDVAPQTEAQPTLYLAQNQVPMQAMTVVVRTVGDPTALAGALRSTIQELDPLLPITDIHPLSRNRLDAMTTPRFNLILMAAFALLALLLASSGIYSVVAFNVIQRRREIGIRLAMGAAPAVVVAGFVRSGFVLLGIGLAVGLALATAGARMLGGLLYGVQPTDVLTFTVVPAVIAVVAFGATYLPARRAADISPTDALRAE